MNAELPKPKREPMPYVFAPRPRCDRCGSADLGTTKTVERNAEAISRRVFCRTCGHKFILVLE